MKSELTELTELNPSKSHEGIKLSHKIRLNYWLLKFRVLKAAGWPCLL